MVTNESRAALEGLRSQEGRADLPLYWRALRLRTLRPNGWQRAVLAEGTLVVAVVLALTGVASAWVVVVLPVLSLAVVKANDVVASLLPGASRAGAKR